MMNFTRTFVSFTSALAIGLGSIAPAVAMSPDKTQNIPSLRWLQDLSKQRVPYPILDLASLRVRREAMKDASGRAMLSRALPTTRTNMRNLTRHKLGMSRGKYRILNTSGDVRRAKMRIAARGHLPLALVQTGRGSSSFGSWNWDRPTRRDIRGDRNLR